MTTELAKIKASEPIAPADSEAGALETHAYWMMRVEEAIVIQVGPVTPGPILLGSLEDARFRVREAIQVKFAREHGDLIAEATEINEFGFGKNMSEAVRDLQLTIVELYLTLQAEQTRLGRDLERTWTVISAKIAKVL